ncbi:E3 ubiquitin- ligase RING1a isoform X1 [Olea europaea subsp. europaea]|uniref:E3 ubiquitin- ligase RING1a isoform X1 n=2 Tax=Olea europaea subsp. europaea TaxID=158383 RepID=A0A8S0PS32_OLEEU|nr:E3 ubiquitin- ligase RING1a isoform X1 [Olea europaea subsp. europaea]CAA2954197.1 E3 ubiquitin- ligase RING1a isoform X1 [Olea europaea subsp. europaea]
MPAQKRPLDTTTPPLSPPSAPEEEDADHSLQSNPNHNNGEAENEEVSNGSPSSSDEEKDEFVIVKLSEIRKEVQCPICLGIIRKTRTVMECLHRFCRECIDKSMRLGNNECPACRTHCASRRSLRDDPNYDALIAALYPDIDKFEEEEFAFHEEEKARNKQIQASIAQTLRRQSEALGKKRMSARSTALKFFRGQGTYRNLRGRRNPRVVEHQGSDEEVDGNGHDGGKDSSSADERSTEIKPKRHKRRVSARDSQISAGGNTDAGYDENDSELNRELVGASAGLVGSSEIRAWGKGGMRSHTRRGSLNGASGKLARNSRLRKLIDHLRCSDENYEALNINLMLVSLHEEKIPSLQRPYLYCSATLSVGSLSQYVARRTSMEASEIEMFVIKDFHPTNNYSSFQKESDCNNELQILTEDQTLGEIHASFTERNLVLAYQQKVQSAGN